MATSSVNHQNTAIKGGASATKTPANTANDPDSSTGSSMLSGMFSSDKKDAPNEPSALADNFRTNKPVGDSGVGGIFTDTVGRAFNKLMGNAPEQSGRPGDPTT